MCWDISSDSDHNDNNSCVAIYKTHPEAEQAITQLGKAGFDITHLSVLASGYHRHENVIGYYNTGEQIKFWGQQGAFWGRLWQQLSGSAFFWVPGIGPLAMGGPLVVIMIDGLEADAVIGGISALGTALYSIGIPKDSIVRYEAAIKSNRFLLIINGDQDEVSRASDLLGSNKEAEIAVHIKTNFSQS